MKNYKTTHDNFYYSEHMIFIKYYVGMLSEAEHSNSNSVEFQFVCDNNIAFR